MTNREAFFSLKKQDNKYLTNTVIKSILVNIGHFSDFFELLNHFDEPIKDEEKYKNVIERIQKGEPYQYVLEEAYFVSSYYYVNKNVLIPRQETEQLAVGTFYYASKFFGLEKPFSIADVCTGSGILAIFLKEKFNNATVVGTDISKEALEVAFKNKLTHNVDVTFYQGDMLKPLLDRNMKFDVLVCNPPYIESKATIDEATWEYEPHLALLANPKTKYYEEIIAQVDKIMNKRYFLAFEIGEDMEEELSKIVELYLPDVIYKFEKDIYNKVRYLYIFGNEKK